MEILPIGTVVYLIEGNQKIIILNIGALVDIEGKEVYFDYTGAIYPDGLDIDNVYYFNNEDIEEIVYKGYIDESHRKLEDKYLKWIKKTKRLKGRTKLN